MTLFGAIGSLFKGIWHAIDGFRKVLHLILLLVIFGILFAATRSSLPFVPGDAALVLAPEGRIVEQLSGDPLDRAVRDATGEGPPETRLQDLLDVIEAGEHDDYLTNPDTLLSREAAQEGEEILAHVYGSLDRARTVARSLRRPHGIGEEKMERLMSLAATLCVAAMVARGRQGFMAVDLGGVTQTFWREMVNAVIKGITYVPPRRRRRRNRATVAKSYATSAKRKRQRRRSKRKTSPSLSDVFGELIKRAL